MARCEKTGKVVYGKKVNALFALVKIQNQKESGHHERRIYKCDYCGNWHLTSMMKAQPL